MRIKINVYRSGSEWFGARWNDNEYDGCDALDVSDNTTEAEALECARTMPLNISGERDVKRVADVDAQGTQ